MKPHYHKTKLKDGTTRDTHRLMMELHLGRRLSRLEHVHHINGDRWDNRIENLSVMPASEHGRLHRAGQPGPVHTPEMRALLSSKLREYNERNRHLICRDDRGRFALQREARKRAA
jgi:hypothetical protein